GAAARASFRVDGLAGNGSRTCGRGAKFEKCSAGALPKQSTWPLLTAVRAPGRAAAEPWGPPPAGLDVSVPHPARVWNYWLGGRDFFAADKAAGEEIGREFPHLAEMARAEREIGRAHV